jgi:predicted O-methyltransferase YrrM
MFGTKTRHYIECDWREPLVRQYDLHMNTEIQIFLRQLEEHARIHDAQESEHALKLLNLEPDTAAIVSILARSSRARRLLEIGTSNGYSTIWLAASVGQEGGHVISIDRSGDKHRMAHDNLLAVGLLQHVDLRLGDATEVIKTLPGPFDFVFFDADRTSAPAQLTLLLPKLAPKALILADNALSHPDEIAGYLTMVKSLEHFQHVLIPVGKGLSVAYADSMTSF